jgi:hypothetical protein
VIARGKNRQFPTAYKLKAIKRVERGVNKGSAGSRGVTVTCGLEALSRAADPVIDNATGMAAS